MLYARSQELLRWMLPGKAFRLIYNIALFAHNTRVKAFDYLYYAVTILYCKIRWRTNGVNKIKTILKIRSYTMVGREGLIKTYDIASKIETENIKGSFVECGVARGGCSALMALTARNNRHIWLFDSFEGMGEPSSEDEHTDPMRYIPSNRASDIVLSGYCLGTFNEVRELLFNKLELNPANIRMVKGWFEDTLPEYKLVVGPISLLRIDCDWYEPTKCCLDNLYDNVEPGGFIIIDDYRSYPGSKKATDEYFENRNIAVDMSFDNRGGCYITK